MTFYIVRDFYKGMWRICFQIMQTQLLYGLQLILKHGVFVQHDLNKHTNMLAKIPMAPGPWGGVGRYLVCFYLYVLEITPRFTCPVDNYISFTI